MSGAKHDKRKPDGPTLEERVAVLEAQLAALLTELRTKGVVVTDDDDREVIEMASSNKGGAHIDMYHPRSEDTMGHLSTGDDLDDDNQPAASVIVVDERQFSDLVPGNLRWVRVARPPDR